MRQKQYPFLFILAVLFVGFLTSSVYAGDEKPAETKAAKQQDNWEYAIEAYVWMPKIEGTSAGGTDFEISSKDILENLDMALMTTFGARKGKWSFMTDVIYMNLDHSDNTKIGSLLTLTDVYMKAWIVDPFVAYEILGNDKGSLQVLAGARFLWIDVGLDLKTRPPLPPEKSDDSGDGDVWDGVVGVRGYLTLSDRWFIPYHLDIGTGDSDKTWQAMAGVGYQFDKFKVAATYRYLKWEFDNDYVLEDLEVYGPMVGAIFTF